MTKAEALRILNICKTHELPRPKRRPHGTGYRLVWTTQVATASASTFKAARHFCRYMWEERRGRSFG